MKIVSRLSHKDKDGYDATVHALKASTQASEIPPGTLKHVISILEQRALQADSKTILEKRVEHEKIVGLRVRLTDESDSLYHENLSLKYTTTVAKILASSSMAAMRSRNILEMI